MASVTRLTLTVLGIGLVASLAAGVVYGLVIEDLAGGVGRAVAIGMSVTAVIGVALGILWPGGHPR